MNLRFWLSAAFLISRIGLFEAALQCQTAEYSIGGMFLRGHTFKKCKIEWNESCYFRCAEEVMCQSYGHNVCELNNRTKEARPEDFMPDQTRFYMKRSKNRGTLLFSFPIQPFLILASLASIVLIAAVNSPIGTAKPPGEKTGCVRGFGAMDCKLIC